jgi:hypothetical protein
MFHAQVSAGRWCSGSSWHCVGGDRELLGERFREMGALVGGRPCNGSDPSRHLIRPYLIDPTVDHQVSRR